MDHHDISYAVLGFGAIVFLGYLLAGVFRKTRIPDVLALTLFGMVLGLHGLGCVRVEDMGKVGPVFTALALIVILFDGGFHLPLAAMRKGLGGTLALALGTFIITIILGTLVAYPLTGSWLFSLFVGFALSNTSTTVILPVLRSLNMGAQVTTTLAAESAITDILCIVGALAVLGAMSGQSCSAATIALDLGGHIGISAILGLTAGLLWRLVMGFVERIPHAMLAEFAFVFVLYGVCECLGGSGPAAVLICSLSIANLPVHWLERFRPAWAPISRVTESKTTLFSEVAFLVKVFFFIYLGLSIRIGNLADFLPGLLLVAGIGLLRVPLVRCFLPRTCTSEEAGIAASLAPKGLVSAVVALMPLQQGIPGAAAIPAIVFPTILMSLVLSSALIPLQNFGWMRRAMAQLFPNHAKAVP